MNGIFINTIQLIGSIILFAVFISISYGIFSGTLEEMLWNLFYSIVEILKPIVAIVLLILCAVKAPSWVESFINSLLEEMRIEREEVSFWRNIEHPTPLLSETANSTPLSENSETTTSGVGEEITCWEHTDNGAIAHRHPKGSAKWQAVIAKNALRQQEQEKKELLQALNERRSK